MYAVNVEESKKEEKLSSAELEKLKEIERLENTYLREFYHFLKFAERRMLDGFNTKEKIRKHWESLWSTKERDISDFSVGAERIVYAFFNTQGFGQPNSCPVGSDLFFEVDDAFIHIDLKTVQTSNIGDYKNTIFVGNNQNSYSERIIKKGADDEDYKAALPTMYEYDGISKPCLTFFITILFDEATLKTLVITVICMPNGLLNKVYGSDVLTAGKNHGKARFNFKNVSKFELLDDSPPRMKVVYFDETMTHDYKTELDHIYETYKAQHHD